MNNILLHVIENFSGSAEDLESAIGFLVLGESLGWKPLLLIHNKRTIRKYESILGIKIRDQFPEEGPYSLRSVGYLTAKINGCYWKAVSGDVKLPDRRMLSLARGL